MFGQRGRVAQTVEAISWLGKTDVTPEQLERRRLGRMGQEAGGVGRKVRVTGEGGQGFGITAPLCARPNLLIHTCCLANSIWKAASAGEKMVSPS